MQSSMTIPKPQTPSEATLRNPARTIRGTGPTGELLATYCCETMSGAVFHVDLGLWSISCPISPALFVQSLADRGYELPNGADLQLWLDAIIGPSRHAKLN